MKILGPPSASFQEVAGRLPETTTSLFDIEMLPELWDAAVTYGIDPVGMVAQSGKETGWGTFLGNVKPWFNNTAGMKVRNDKLVMALLGTTNPDHPLVHQQFPNWETGAHAHAQHLVRYTGGDVSQLGLIVDPRWTLVGPPFITTWAELNDRWAGPTYGTELEAIITRLRGA